MIAVGCRDCSALYADGVCRSAQRGSGRGPPSFRPYVARPGHTGHCYRPRPWDQPPDGLCLSPARRPAQPETAPVPAVDASMNTLHSLPDPPLAGEGDR